RWVLIRIWEVTPLIKDLRETRGQTGRFLIFCGDGTASCCGERGGLFICPSFRQSEQVMNPRNYLVSLLSASFLSLIFTPSLSAQKPPKPTRLWSKGPLTKGEVVGSFSFGSDGVHLSNPHIDSQTGSVFSA